MINFVNFRRICDEFQELNEFYDLMRNLLMRNLMQNRKKKFSIDFMLRDLPRVTVEFDKDE